MQREWCCVVRLGSIGDNLIASSVLPLLAKEYQVEVICQTPNHVIFENNPHVSKLTVWKPEDIPPYSSDAWWAWRDVRAKEYARFIDLSQSCEVTLAYVKAQVQFRWPAAVRRKWCDRSYLAMVHDLAEVRYEFAPKFFPTDEERERATVTKAKVGERVIGWALSGSRIDKIWPYAPIAIARMIKEFNLPVILFGGPGKDYDIALQIKEHVERQNGSLAGLHLAISPSQEVAGWVAGAPGEKLKLEGPKEPLWPIRRSLSQIQACDLVITVDSGLGWGVASEAMPKIMLLSHASQKNITHGWINTVTLQADSHRVPCHPCHQLHDSIDTCVPNSTNTGAACISDIPIDTVLRAARDLFC